MLLLLPPPLLLVFSSPIFIRGIPIHINIFVFYLIKFTILSKSIIICAQQRNDWERMENNLLIFSRHVCEIVCVCSQVSIFWSSTRKMICSLLYKFVTCPEMELNQWLIWSYYSFDEVLIQFATNTKERRIKKRNINNFR